MLLFFGFDGFCIFFSVVNLSFLEKTLKFFFAKSRIVGLVIN